MDFLAQNSLEFTGKAAPSDAVSKKLLKKFKADETKKLVAQLTSKELLLELVKTEKRIGVIHVLAENKNLPDEAIEILLENAFASNRDEIAWSLLKGRTLEEIQALVAKYPELKNRREHLEIVIEKVVRSFYNKEPESFFLKAVELFPEAKLRLVHEACTIGDFVSDRTLFEVAKSIEKSVWNTLSRVTQRRSLAERLISENTPKDFVQKVVEAFPWPEIYKTVTQHRENDAFLFEQHRLVESLESDNEVEDLVRYLKRAGIPLTKRSAELLTTKNLTYGARREMLCSPEAAEVLLRVENVMPGLFIAQLGDSAKMVQELTKNPSATSSMDISMIKAWELKNAGLEDDLLWELLKSGLGNKYTYEQPSEALRNYILRYGPPSLTKRFSLTKEEAFIVTEREDAGSFETLLFLFLKNGDVNEDLIKRIAPVISNIDLYQWLVAAGDEVLSVETLKWIFSNLQEEKVSYLRENLKGFRGNASTSANLAEVVALDWKYMSSDKIMQRVFSSFKNAFEEDIAKWQTALTLFPEWTGTIPELIETVETVS